MPASPAKRPRGGDDDDCGWEGEEPLVDPSAEEANGKAKKRKKKKPKKNSSDGGWWADGRPQIQLGTAEEQVRPTASSSSSAMCCRQSV